MASHKKMVALTEQMIRGKTRLDKMDEVRNLNLWGQDLDDVSLLSRLAMVEILSLSVNRITTLRDFTHCLKLQELYLRKNEVADVAELQYLQPLRDLKVLWLSDNPCADHPYYRQLAVRILPGLEKLDSQEVTSLERQQAARNPELDKYLSVPLDPTSPRPVSKQEPSPQRASPAAPDRLPSASSAPGQRNKNILYAVMALVSELEMEDLVYVRREIEQRLEAQGTGRRGGYPGEGF